MGDTHSEVTIMPLQVFDFLQHQFLFFVNQESNVSQLVLLKQEWLFHVTTNVQFVFHSSLTN